MRTQTHRHTQAGTQAGRHAGTQGHNATTQPIAYRGVREAVLAHEHLDLRWRCLLTVEAMAAVIPHVNTRVYVPTTRHKATATAAEAMATCATYRNSAVS